MLNTYANAGFGGKFKSLDHIGFGSLRFPYSTIKKLVELFFLKHGILKELYFDTNYESSFF